MIAILLSLGILSSEPQTPKVEPESSGLFVKNVATAAIKTGDRLKLAGVARCYVTRNRAVAEMMVLDQWSLRRIATNQYHWGLGKVNCMPPDGPSYRVDFPPDLFLYAVADALVGSAKRLSLGDLPQRARVKLLTPTLPPGASFASMPPKARQQLIAELTLPVFSECVVRSAPGSVEALLRTGIASQQEAATLSALGGSLGACVAQGVTYSLSPEALRGNLALAYYRLAHAPMLAPANAGQ